MVRQVHKHRYGIISAIGFAVLFGLMTGALGTQAVNNAGGPPSCYAFEADPGRTGLRDDGYHVAGLLTKQADCEILDPPLGFQARVWVGPGDPPQPVDWRDADAPQGNRPVGQSDLNVILDLPEFYHRAEVYTQHVYPARDTETDGDRFLIETTTYEITGNVVGQRAVSAQEVAK